MTNAGLTAFGEERIGLRRETAGWLALAAALVFLVLLFGVQQAGLPQAILLVVPAALAALLIFAAWPTAALVVWTLGCGLVPLPLLGREVFLYDLFSFVLAGLWVLKVFSTGRMRFQGADWPVLIVAAAALLSVLVNLGRMSTVAERMMHEFHIRLEFLGKTNLSAGLLWSSYLLAYFFASRLADTQRKIRWTLAAVLLMALGNAVYALIRWILNPMGFSRQNRTDAFFQEAQDQGYLSALLLTGILVALALHVVKGWRRWAVFGAGGVILLNLVCNFTRAVYVEFALAATLLFGVLRSRQLILLAILAAILIAGVLMISNVDEQYLVMFTDIGSKKAQGLSLRVESWSDAIRIFREDGGFWGVGLGNYMVYSKVRVTMPSLRRVRLASAHGMYLQVLAEQGILGVAAWAIFFISLLAYFIRKLRGAGTPAQRGMNLWAVLILVMYLWDGVFYMVLLPPGHSHETLTAGYYVWVVLGLVEAQNRLAVSPRREPAEG